MTLIKVCGITTLADAKMVAEAGVDWIGLNFWPESKRYVDQIRGRSISAEARRCNQAIKVVGLFVNQSAPAIADTLQAADLDYVQLHGDESPAFANRFGERCIKAVALRGDEDLVELAAFACGWKLVDSVSPGRGGSGQVANWDLAAKAASREENIWLAGGLNPENVAEAIRVVKPYGVDVASGVESEPGIKSDEKLRAFVEAVRGVQ